MYIRNKGNAKMITLNGPALRPGASGTCCNVYWSSYKLQKAIEDLIGMMSDEVLLGIEVDDIGIRAIIDKK